MAEENVLAVFPGVDLKTLPEWLARVEKTIPPKLGEFEEYTQLSFVRAGDSVVEVHNVLEVSKDERAKRIQMFNEDVLKMVDAIKVSLRSEPTKLISANEAKLVTSYLSELDSWAEKTNEIGKLPIPNPFITVEKLIANSKASEKPNVID